MDDRSGLAGKSTSIEDTPLRQGMIARRGLAQGAALLRDLDDSALNLCRAER
jgi:hypothetical protein